MEHHVKTLKGLLGHIQKALAVNLDGSSAFRYSDAVITTDPGTNHDYASFLLKFSYPNLPLISVTLHFEKPECIEGQFTVRLPELRISFGNYSFGAFSGAESGLILANANQLLCVVDEAAKDYCRS